MSSGLGNWRPALLLLLIPLMWASEGRLETAAGQVSWSSVDDGPGPGGAWARAEDLGQGRARLRAWSQRRDGPDPVTHHQLSLTPSVMPWIRLDRLALRIGQDMRGGGGPRAIGADVPGAGDGWSFGWQRARDLRLRLCWREGDAGDGPVFAGGVATADTLVCELCLRHGIGGDDTFTVHGWDFTAIYQVPKGVAASEARKLDANRLGMPTMLKTLRPNRQPGFAFVVGSEGRWQFHYDADGDGAPERTLAATDADCRASTLRLNRPRPSIWLVANSPDRAGQLSTATLDVGFGAAARWVEDARNAPALGWVGARPIASAVSPAAIRVEVEPGCAVSASDATGAALVSDPTGAHHATITLPLDPARETAVTISADGKPPARLRTAITWSRTTIAADLPPLRVLRGSSLLLDAPRAQSIRCEGEGGEARTLPPDGPCRFDVTGALLLRAIGGDGASRALLVTPTDLPDPLPMPKGGRALEVACDRPAAEIAWSIEDGAGSLQVLSSSGSRCRLAIKPDRTECVLLANDAAGAVLQRIRVVRIAIDGGSPDTPARVIDPAANPGVDASQFRVVISPYVPGVTLRCIAIDSRCCFNGDLGAIDVVSDGGPATSGEPGMRRLDGDGGPVGVFDYAILSPSWDGGWAHRHALVFPGDEAMPKKLPKAVPPPPRPTPTPAQPRPGAPPPEPGANEF